MTGWLALHGGAEFLAGDEPFLDAIVQRAIEGRGGSARGDALRVVVLPTAAARGRPDLAGASGVAALERAAGRAGSVAEVAVVPVLDRASAADPALAGRIAAADLVHLPGGDPDLLPAVLPGTASLEALVAVLARGGCVAGASAGAMALADPCWTPAGLVPGLAFLPGVLVVPHTDARSWAARRARFAAERPAGVGLLGLAERTGIIGPAGAPGDAWQVAGAGEVRWLAGDRLSSEAPRVARPGTSIRLT